MFKLVLEIVLIQKPRPFKRLNKCYLFCEVLFNNNIILVEVYLLYISNENIQNVIGLFGEIFFYLEIQKFNNKSF